MPQEGNNRLRGNSAGGDKKVFGRGTRFDRPESGDREGGFRNRRDDADGEVNSRREDRERAPRRENDRRGGDFRPARGFDRPDRGNNDRSDFRARGGDDRPARRGDDSRPARGGDRPSGRRPRRGDDNPPRRADGNIPGRRPEGDFSRGGERGGDTYRPARGGFNRNDDSRPARGGDRREGGFRKPGFGADREENRFSRGGERRDNDRGNRFEDRPRRDRENDSFSGNQGENNFDRPARREGDRSFNREGRGGRDRSRSFDRPDRDDRSARGNRPDRNERPDRGGRFERAPKSFGPREERGGRNTDDVQDAPQYNLKRYEERQKKRNPEGGNEEWRLNRYIANAGICSRREADELIASGEIKVNGEVVTEMGYRVGPNDTVTYGRKTLNRQKTVYVLLNKPKDFITTTEDPEGRKTVMELVKNASKERLFPVGRLDRNTTGLLLFTNDGELAQKLTHPSNDVSKIYQVELDKPITEEDFKKVQAGVELEDGKAEVDDVALIGDSKKFLGLEIHIGRNRIVRRIFEHLGYEVVTLDRVQYAGLTKKDLPRGNWRFLSEKEVVRLKYFM